MFIIRIICPEFYNNSPTTLLQRLHHILAHNRPLPPYSTNSSTTCILEPHVSVWELTLFQRAALKVNCGNGRHQKDTQVLIVSLSSSFFNLQCLIAQKHLYTYIISSIQCPSPSITENYAPNAACV